MKTGLKKDRNKNRIFNGKRLKWEPEMLRYLRQLAKEEGRPLNDYINCKPSLQ